MGVLEDIYESEMFHPLKIETTEYKQALDRVCKAEDELINLKIETTEYKQALDRVCKAEDELINTYPECKELFLKYQEAENNLVHIDTRDIFVAGMRIGSKITMEIFVKSDYN